MPLRRVALVTVTLVALAAAACLGTDALVRVAFESWASQATGAAVTASSASLSPLRAQLVMSQVTVLNPAGFPNEPAFVARRLDIDLDLSTLLSDTLVVSRVTVTGLELRHSRSGERSNLDQIEHNLCAFLEETGHATSPRVVVEQLVVPDGTASASAKVVGRVTVPLRALEYRDIGKTEGGLTPPALVRAVFDLLRPSLARALSQTDYGDLFGGAVRGLEKAGRKLKGLFE